MKKLTFLFIIICAIALSFHSCKKDEITDTSSTDSTTERMVLTDFANFLANPNYLDIQTKANALNAAVQSLNSSTTDINLGAARAAWRDTRSAWEKAEGYLFGPVEDFNYDPTMDDWPIDKIHIDSLLGSSNSLTLADIDALPTSLKGFHAIEYILFGVGGSRVAADLTDREKLFMVSLTQSLFNTTTDLRNSWDPSQPGNFTQQLITAGIGSTTYTTRKAAFLAIVTSMAGICEEVAGGKMEDPLAAQDSTLEESQFSHNSTADFKNNMTGVLNAYTGKYTSDGHSMDELVSTKNLSLHNRLISQMNAAINSFNSIDANYGAAIYTQQVQIHNAQDAINTLKSTLENDLMHFIDFNIKD